MVVPAEAGVVAVPDKDAFGGLQFPAGLAQAQAVIEILEAARAEALV